MSIMAIDKKNRSKSREPTCSKSTPRAGDRVHDKKLNVVNQIHTLKSWLEEHGVEYSTEDFEIKPSESGGIGIFSQRDLKKNSTLATIPKSAILSIVNSRLCDKLKALEGAFQRSDQALAFAYADEKKRGTDSPFHGYIATVPDYEPIPLLWSHEALESLQGSELEVDTIAAEREDLWMEYALSIRLLGWVDDKADSAAEAVQVSFSEWIAARSLVSSRAFYVDPLHKSAMVPLADVFNHKAAIMDIPEDAIIAEEDEDEDEDYDVKDLSEQADASPSTRENDKTSCLPFCDDETCFGNCKPTVNAIGVRSRAADLNVNIDWQMTMLRSEDEKSLLVTIMSDVPSKVEIFNCYGEKANGTLLKDYGFSLQRNPFDIVNLDIQLIEDALFDLGRGDGNEQRLRKRPLDDGYDVRAHRLLRRKLLKHLGSHTEYVQLEQNGLIPPELIAGIAEVIGVQLQDVPQNRHKDSPGDSNVDCSIWDDPETLLTHALKSSRLLGDVILKAIELRKQSYGLSKRKEENIAKMSMENWDRVQYLSLDKNYWTPDLRAIKKCEATDVMASRVIFGELSALNIASESIKSRVQLSRED